MIDHLSIGVSDVASSKAFYDAVLTPLGYECIENSAESLGYGAKQVVLWVNLAERPVRADPDSGLHICFAAPSRKAVAAFYEAALANGGKDNGKPGVRKDYGPHYYAAFAVDPDGYRLEAHTEAKD